MADAFGRIKIDSGIKKIVVNDDGDYIALNVADTAFYSRFAAMVDWMEIEMAHAKEIGDKLESAKDIHEKTAAILEMTKIYEECGRQVDAFFGPDTCAKVFGGVTAPDALLLGEFFEQITPIVEEAVRERGEAINSKYNRNRKGA